MLPNKKKEVLDNSLWFYQKFLDNILIQRLRGMLCIITSVGTLITSVCLLFNPKGDYTTSSFKGLVINDGGGGGVGPNI